MKASSAASVRSAVESMPVRAFVHSRSVAGPTGAVEAELSRLARKGEIRRVRKGLYWKGPKTRLGIAAPPPEDVAIAVAGIGAGPAGIAAAQWLGLTSQVPGTPEVAVPGRVPMEIRGVRFCARSPRRREFGLRPMEVAVLEVLRDWPMSVEEDWAGVESRICELVTEGAIRPEQISGEVAEERHPSLRQRWSQLETLLPVQKRAAT